MADDDTIRVSARSSGLASVALRVGSIRGVERLNAPYELTVRLSFDDADADPTAMLGRDFELELDREAVVRRFVGLVREVALGDSLGERNTVWHEVTVVPALHLLSHRRDTRIFQDKTALEIVQEVLEAGLRPFNRSFDVLASATYPKREYCLQYQETDLDFVHRLMEEEGIGYFFSHDGETEVLTLTDANAQFPRALTVAGDGTVRHREDGRPLAGFEVVHDFQRTARTTTTSVVVRDHDFTGGQTPEAEERSTDALGRDRESYEHGLGRSLTIGDYSGTAYGANDAARQALLRKEGYLSRGIECRGAGHAVGFTAGTTFALVDHTIVGVDGEYLLTEVEHRFEGDLAGGRPRADNRFVCIPLSTPYRPARRTPKPSVAGYDTAIVTGPAGEEIHTDEHGRVKVQFHWDRQGQSDEHTTCFIRVRQPWAGEGWGFVFLPRIGMEVVVAFDGGDPDRPFVEGCVYDGDHAPPYALPDEKTKSTIKSQSSIGAPSGFNELRFEDKAGKEEIFTHAQKDQNEIVRNDHTTDVGGDQTNHVHKTQTQKIHKNQTENVDGIQTMTVGTDRTVHVKGAFDETIEQGEHCKIDQGVTETITSFENRTVTGGLNDQITGGEIRAVTGGFEENITGTHVQHVLGPNLEVLLSGSTQTMASGQVTFETDGTHTMHCGGPIAYNGMAGIKMYATISSETTDFHVKPDPFSHEFKSTKGSQAATSIALMGKRTQTIGVSAAAGILKAGMLGQTISVTGIKATIAPIKIEGYLDKEDLAAAKASPAEVKVSTN